GHDARERPGREGMIGRRGDVIIEQPAFGPGLGDGLDRLAQGGVVHVPGGIVAVRHAVGGAGTGVAVAGTRTHGATLTYAPVTSGWRPCVDPVWIPRERAGHAAASRTMGAR